MLAAINLHSLLHGETLCSLNCRYPADLYAPHATADCVKLQIQLVW